MNINSSSEIDAPETYVENRNENESGKIHESAVENEENELEAENAVFKSPDETTKINEDTKAADSDYEKLIFEEENDIPLETDFDEK